MSGRRSTPRASSVRRWGRDHADARPVAGEVRRARADLGVELPPHEGGAGVALRRQISALRILSGALVITLLLLAGGGRLPTGARVWGTCSCAGSSSAPAVHAVRAVGDADQLGARGHGNAATPSRRCSRRWRSCRGAGLVAGSSRGRRVPRGHHDHAAVDGDRPTDLVGFSMALAGCELRDRLDLQPALPQQGRPRRALAACGDAPHRPRAHGAGDPRLGVAAARGARGSVVLRPRMPARGCGCRSCARSCSASWGRASPTCSSSTSSAAPDR